MCRSLSLTLSLFAALAIGTANSRGAICPANAGGTGVSVGLRITFADGITQISGQPLAPCETIKLQMSVSWVPSDVLNPGSAPDAAFSGGQMRIIGGSLGGTFASGGAIVTPGPIPLIGNPDPTQDPACIGISGIASLQIPYTVSAADAAAGSISFQAIYEGGTSIFPGATPGQTGGFIPGGVTVAPCPAPGVCETVACDPAAITLLFPPSTTLFRQGQCVRTPLTPPTCSIASISQCAGTSGSLALSILTDPNGGAAITGWTKNGASLGSTANPLSVTVPAAGVIDTYVATIQDSHGCQNTCTATVTGLACNPRIVVYKQVVCEQPGPTCGTFGAAATDNKSASGVKGNGTCPAFCYKITVQNTGDVDLNSVTVTDPTLSLASCTFPTTLAIGQTATCTIAGVQVCNLGDTPNTVTAQGQSVSDSSANGHVQSQDTVHVTVVPISVTCEVSLQSTFDLDNNPTDNHVTLPADQQNAPVAIVVTLNNPSAVDLSVTISGLPALVSCADDVTPVPPPGAVTVPAGSHVDVNVGCVLVSCPAGLSLTLTVQGTAIASTTVPCIYDSQGIAITTATSTCPATVTCQQPATCRVTGGGVLLPDEVEEGTCSQSITTVVSGPKCNALEALKITHGGQLGAPYSRPSCGTVAALPQGDPCIRGQWEHVRHYQGKANPASYVEVDNFHSNTPKGIFDMLQCACLPCCEKQDAGGLIGALCNPDDHKICGPEPRPAPANAIIFTGVGYMRTCESSNQKGKGSSQAVIFRVYIEDRSEPGGQHPGGGKAPADVYSYQAWPITGQYDSAANIALRQAVATDSCNFINNYTQGSLPNANIIGAPLINDSGALHTGNHQIHPSTSATCAQ